MADELLQALTKTLHNGRASSNDNGGRGVTQTHVSMHGTSLSFQGHGRGQGQGEGHILSAQQSRRIQVLVHRVCTLGLEGSYYLHHFHAHAAEVAAAESFFEPPAAGGDN